RGAAHAAGAGDDGLAGAARRAVADRRRDRRRPQRVGRSGRAGPFGHRDRRNRRLGRDHRQDRGDRRPAPARSGIDHRARRLRGGRRLPESVDVSRGSRARRRRIRVPALRRVRRSGGLRADDRAWAIGYVAGANALAWIVVNPVVGALTDRFSWRAAEAVPAALVVAALLAVRNAAPVPGGRAAPPLRGVLADASARRWIGAELIAYGAWTGLLTFVGAFFIDTFD